MGMVVPGDFKWFTLSRHFTLTVFVLTVFSLPDHHRSVGVDPTVMGIGPAFAIRELLQNNSLSLEDIDLVEVL